MLGDGLSRGQIDLQGTDDPLLIVGVETGGGIRVRPGQLVQQGLAPLPPDPLLQLGTEGAVRVKVGEGPPGKQGVDIQSGPSGHDGQTAPGENVVHTAGGHVHIPGHREVFFRLGHIQHMVGHTLHLLMGGLGGADVHAAVDLHGVGGHHLAAPGLGQRHRQLCLAGGGGAADD